MTAIETIERAQDSVEQIQRGIGVVQEKLEQADVLVQVVENVVEEVRSFPRRRIMCAGVALGCVVVGVTVLVIVKKKKARRRADENDS